ncbi:Abhydrolase superfamily protein [Trichophyton interdigitale]|nr:Abhydrolase superfamily protein [Trichophyton interdigitale]KAG5218231.1 Abhydrolase superfamily protein [Trichophyton interdigitale]KAG8206645.1 Abhydrolase superfamily protein [Trichophyton interdigitale]
MSGFKRRLQPATGLAESRYLPYYPAMIDVSNATQRVADPALLQMQPKETLQPLINSIPEELMGRFDPVYVEHYNRHNAGRLHTHQIPIEEFRKNPGKYVINYGQTPGPEVFCITERKLPVNGGTITVRVFEMAPIKLSPGRDKKRGAYINFHGGGWVFGNLDTDHHKCKRIANELQGEVVVFDVDYRLAPEHPYPTAIEDCWAAVQWVRSRAIEFNLDISRLAVGGASAGGHLAAVMAHLCRDYGYPLKLQLLIVPVVDMHSSFTADGKFDRKNTPYESYREMEHTVPLSAERMAYFHRQWLGVPRPVQSEADWMISPIFAPNFADLAPAIVWTAEMDPLRDEGAAYVKKLESAGVKVEHICVPGAPHTFSHHDAILEGGKLFKKQSIAALADALRDTGL